MTLVGICKQCKEEKRPGQPFERRILGHGPNGEHLCKEHRREAWEEENNV